MYIAMNNYNYPQCNLQNKGEEKTQEIFSG
jgi:hypothetical protein